MNSLKEIGFQSIGKWRSSSSGLKLSLNKLGDKAPALYAFIVAGEVKYVGKTTQSLRQRLYFYRKPGKSQRTNIRVKAEILEALGAVDVVEIFGFHDPQPRHIGRFKINLPAGLEDDIIRQLRPEWNGGRKLPTSSQFKSKGATNESSGNPLGTRGRTTENDPSRPSFVITIGKTYFRQGFFNVPIDCERYFAKHGAEIAIKTPDQSNLIYGKINRTVNSNNTPRIMGGTHLRDWLQSHIQLGERLHVGVLEPTHIEIQAI